MLKWDVKSFMLSRAKAALHLHRTLKLHASGGIQSFQMLCVFLLMLCNTVLYALQNICVPHLGVPTMEPADEGQRFLSLLNDADGSTATARGVRIHIIFSWKRKARTMFVCEDSQSSRSQLF